MASDSRNERKVRRKAIVILGMHRSGTSALARTLNMLGCDLPKTLMGEAKSNREGHWESLEVMRLNDEILESGGSRWDDWVRFNPGWYGSPVVEGYIERGQEILRAEFGTSPLFVFKDPRNCRLFPFWRDVLVAENVEPLIAIPIRNPLEVAQSLHKRDDMHPDLGRMLWLGHILDSEADTREMKRVFCSYDQMLENWPAIADTMQRAFDMPWPRMSAAVRAQIDQFLDTDSRHHVSRPDAVLANPALSDWLRTVYKIMIDWTEKGEKAEDHATLDAVREQMSVVSPAFSGVILAAVNDRARLSTVEQHAEARGIEIVRLNSELSTLAAARAMERAEAETSQAMLQALVDQATERRMHFESLHLGSQADLEQARQAQGDIEGRLNNVISTLESDRALFRQKEASFEQALFVEHENALLLMREKEALEQNLGDMQAASQQHGEERIELARQVQELKESALANTGERIELEKQLADAKSKLKASQEAVGQAEQDHTALKDRIATTESALRQREEEIEQTRAAVAAENARNFELERVLKEQGSALQSMQERIEYISAENRAKEAEIARLSGRSIALDAELREAEQQIASARAELADKVREAGAIGAVLAEGEVRLRETMVERDEARARSEDEIIQRSAMADMMRFSEAEAARAGEARIAAEARLDEYANELAVMTEILRAREADLHNLASARDQAEARIHTHEARIQAQIGEWEYDKAIMSRRADENTQKVEELEDLLRERHSALEAANREITGIRAAAFERTLQMTSLTDALDAQQRYVAEVARQAEWLRSINNAMTDLPSWWVLLPRIWRQRWERQRLLNRGLFDADAYLARYPDVANAGIDPLSHYIMHGMTEGRTG